MGSATTSGDGAGRHGRDVRPPDVAPVDVVAVGADGWARLEAFFGPSGAYSHCWCTWWRQPSAAFDAGCRDGGAGNRALLESLVRAGREPGLVALESGAPVGWVSVAPRTEYVRLARSPLLRGTGDLADDGVWALPCFWVPRAHRGRGVASTLLAAAVDHAKARGARVLEAYPVAAAGRLAAAEAYTGTVTLFSRFGFRVVRRPPTGRRVVVRRDLGEALR
ncbi:MAG TPA: GNAT family N-acetyltransferase [Actinomycetes bacterium]|nr:GNAT family N-acetyltransferase [Actinomycetes bacterium]